MRMNLSDVEEWKGGALLPLGWNRIQVSSAEETTASTGNAQWKIQMTSAQGEMTDYVTLTHGTRPRVKALLLAAGVTIPDGEANFTAEALIGKTYEVFIGEEPKYDDRTKTVKRVQAYRAPEAAQATRSGDDDIPF